LYLFLHVLKFEKRILLLIGGIGDQ
jgi:hypothetical protein